jgi:uncharacterized membrane protein YphA (DoxX/SURF4 family)
MPLSDVSVSSGRRPLSTLLTSDTEVSIVERLDSEGKNVAISPQVRLAFATKKDSEGKLMEAVAVILLAGVFAVAGFVKLRAPLAFRAVLQQLMPSSVARRVGRVVPIAELGTSLLLLSGVAPHLAAGVAMTLLVVFVVILAQMWRRGASMDCGCFGE